MEYLLKNKCHKCGYIGEPKLDFSGKHIKQSCNNCGSYQRFIEKSLIPDVKTIKMRIAFICNNDFEYIIKIKEQIGIFYKEIKGMDEKIAYWKLYLKIIFDEKYRDRYIMLVLSDNV